MPPASRRLVLSALAAVTALAGCAEVTRFDRGDKAAIYHVKCHDSLAWFESCGAAARRTCPEGYAPADVVLHLAADQERRPTPHPDDLFFVCRAPSPPNW